MDACKIILLFSLLLFTALSTTAPNVELVYPPLEVAEEQDSYTIDEFIDYALIYAHLTHLMYGTNPITQIGQTILESRHGNSMLTKLTNNSACIKCHYEYFKKTPYWDGKGVPAKDDRPKDCFRKYKSLRYSFYDYGYHLSKSPRFSKTLNLPVESYALVLKRLHDATYATDRNYFAKVSRIIEKYKIVERYERFRIDYNSRVYPIIITPICYSDS